MPGLSSSSLTSPCLVMPGLTLPSLSSPCPAPPCPAPPCHTRPCLSSSCTASPCPASSPSPTLPNRSSPLPASHLCHARPLLSLPCPALPYPASPCLALCAQPHLVPWKHWQQPGAPRGSGASWAAGSWYPRSFRAFGLRCPWLRAARGTIIANMAPGSSSGKVCAQTPLCSGHGIPLAQPFFSMGGSCHPHSWLLVHSECCIPLSGPARR